MKKQLILFVLALMFLATVLNGCINEPGNDIDGSSGNGGNGFTSQGKIAFQTGGSIHLINPDGTNEIRLCEGQGPILWSKDSKRLCYYYPYCSKLDMENGCEPTELVVVNTDGVEINRIPIGDLNLTVLDFHPSGNKLLCAKYTYYHTNYHTEYGDFQSSDWKIIGLYSIDIDSNNIVQLESINNVTYAVYSPDGKITYSKDNGEIYICDSDGKNSYKLLGNLNDIILKYSPDGTMLSTLGDKGLYVVNVENGEKNLLEAEILSLIGGFYDFSHYRPRGGYWSGWSPDSKKIAYWSGSSRYSQSLYISNSDGTGKIKITTAEIDNNRLYELNYKIGIPSWSPDGKRIVYSVEDSIYIANADGSNIKYLCSGSYPKWSPK